MSCGVTTMAYVFYLPETAEVKWICACYSRSCCTTSLFVSSCGTQQSIKVIWAKRFLNEVMIIGTWSTIHTVNYCLNRNQYQKKYDLSASWMLCHSKAVYQPLTQPQVQSQARPHGINNRQSGTVPWFLAILQFSPALLHLCFIPIFQSSTTNAI